MPNIQRGRGKIHTAEVHDGFMPLPACGGNHSAEGYRKVSGDVNCAKCLKLQTKADETPAETAPVATAVKLSDTMDEALYYLGWGTYRAHLEPSVRTLEALERRGLIRWSTDAELGAGGEHRVHDTTRLWTVTLDGWAFLKAEHDMDRPADEGRLTVAEALADVTQVQVNGRVVMISETEYAACVASWAKHGTVPSPATNDWAAVARLRGEIERVEEERGSWEIGVFYRVVTPTEPGLTEAETNAIQWARKWGGFIPTGTTDGVVASLQLKGLLTPTEKLTAAGWDAGRLSLADALEEADRHGGLKDWGHNRVMSQAEVTEAERRDLFDTVKHVNRPETQREDWETYLSPGEQRYQDAHPDEVVNHVAPENQRYLAHVRAVGARTVSIEPMAPNPGGFDSPLIAVVPAGHAFLIGDEVLLKADGTLATIPMTAPGGYVRETAPDETRAEWKERNFYRHYGSAVAADLTAPGGYVQSSARRELAARMDVGESMRRDLADRLGEPRGRSWSHLLDRVDQLKATALEHAPTRGPLSGQDVTQDTDALLDADRPIPYRLAAEEAGSGAGGGPQDGDDLYADPDRWRAAPVTYKCPVCRHDFAAEEIRDTHVVRHHG